MFLSSLFSLSVIDTGIKFLHSNILDLPLHRESIFLNGDVFPKAARGWLRSNVIRENSGVGLEPHPPPSHTSITHRSTKY